MNVVAYTRDHKAKYSSRDVLHYLRVNLCRVTELVCEETFSDSDVVDLCEILLKANPAEVNLKILRLSSSQLSIQSAHALARVLHVNTTITTLDLRHNLLLSEGVEVLVKPLYSSNRTLKSLILKDNHLSQLVGKPLAVLLNQNDFIEELHLGHNDLGARGIKPIATALGSTMKTNLRRLHLAHNHLRAKGLQHLVAAMMQNQKHSISFLDLTCNKLGHKGMSALQEWIFIKREKSIQHLWLGSNDFGDNCGSMMSSILKDNSTLIELRLDGNQLGDAGVRALSDGLSQNTNLEILDLNWNQIGNVGAEALAGALRTNGKLKTLDLSGNNIAEQGCIAMAKAIPYLLELKELNMNENVMKDEAAEAFAHVLTERHCVLDKLHWKGNSDLTREAIKRLELAMQHRQNMRCWFTPEFVQRIQDNQIWSIDWSSKRHISDIEVIKLASVLNLAKENSRLREINITGENISSKGIKDLAEWIASPKCSLARFFIRSSSIGDNGVQAIAVALESNTSLRSLNLHGSLITAVGATSLGHALMKNQTLTRLSLAHNQIGTDGLFALARGIQHSRKITALNVMSNKLKVPAQSEVWNELVKSSIQELCLRDNDLDNDVVFGLAKSLQHGCPFRILDFAENRITTDGAWLLTTVLEKFSFKVDFRCYR